MKKIFYLTIITLFIAGCGSTKELMDQNQSLSSQINDFQTEITELSSRNEKLNTKIISLEKTNTNIDTRLEQCNDNINSLTSIYYTYNSKIQKLKNELEAGFPNNLYDDNFAIIEEDGRLIIRLPNRILYTSGSAEFNDEALVVVQKLSKIFRNNQGLSLLVEGHTDDIPLKTGSKYEDNWDLSLARAVKITRQLETYGVHPQRITAAGRANFAPIDRTVSDEARAKNRRTEIIIRPKIAEVLKAMSDLNK